MPQIYIKYNNFSNVIMNKVQILWQAQKVLVVFVIKSCVDDYHPFVD